MTITELQKAIGVHPDGLWGNLSRKALLHTFTSSNTAALSADQASLIAKRLGVSAKQLSAVGKVEAAFMACSWGKFQVLGEYWDDFHFASPFEMELSTVASEAGHYQLLAYYVEANNLQDEMAALSTMRKPAAPLPEPITAPSTSNSTITTNWLQR